jgi:uncharacterized protein YbjQ (UPF0145 family)
MRAFRLTIVAAVLVSLGGAAEARNDRLTLPIADALRAGKDRLDPGVRLYFGNPGPGGSQLGRFTANRKTNGGGKSDKEACEWAFLSSVIALQERARREGGNAVVGIVSIYKRRETSSATQYVCAAGNVVVGVAFRGTVVRL